MNAIVPSGNAPAPTGLGLVPRNMQEAMQLAEMMARGKMMPDHLKNPGDALMVVEQAMRWQMSPFAVAQSTFNIKGKLLFAGTIVAAAIENSGAILGLMDYQFSGEGQGRKVVVSAMRRGENEPRTVEVALKDAQTENGIWKKQPDQQLCYHGARVWARRWTPGVMLGVYTPEEWREQAPDTFVGTTIEASAQTEEVGTEETKKKGPTINEWLADLERFFAEALASENPREAVDAILARDDVQKAEDRFSNGAKAKLTRLIQDALAATAKPNGDDDTFPGDRP